MILLDVASSVLVLAGVGLLLLGSIGLLRFPDALTRMHAQTKPTVLGLLLLLAGVGLEVRTLTMIGPLALVAAFQVLTSPVGAHMIGRAIHRDARWPPVLVRNDLANEAKVVSTTTDTPEADTPKPETDTP